MPLKPYGKTFKDRVGRRLLPCDEQGNNRQDIFLTDKDRKAFLEALADSCEIYNVNLMAYVLMTNHFHLLVHTARANLSEFMRHFQVTYTVRFNRSHHRSGHVSQGRFNPK